MFKKPSRLTHSKSIEFQPQLSNIEEDISPSNSPLTVFYCINSDNEEEKEICNITPPARVETPPFNLRLISTSRSNSEIDNIEVGRSQTAPPALSIPEKFQKLMVNIEESPRPSSVRVLDSERDQRFKIKNMESFRSKVTAVVTRYKNYLDVLKRRGSYPYAFPELISNEFRVKTPPVCFTFEEKHTKPR